VGPDLRGACAASQDFYFEDSLAELDDLPATLDGLSVEALRAACGACGLPEHGDRARLAARLTTHMSQVDLSQALAEDAPADFLGLQEAPGDATPGARSPAGGAETPRAAAEPATGVAGPGRLPAPLAATAGPAGRGLEAWASTAAEPAGRPARPEPRRDDVPPSVCSDIPAAQPDPRRRASEAAGNTGPPPAPSTQAAGPDS